MSEQCEFCDIVRGMKSAYRVYHDNSTMAFLDANPIETGHVLVVPKQHQEHIIGGENGVAVTVFETVELVTQALQDVLDPDGFSMFYTTASLFGSVTHAHVHIVPRYDDDNIRLGLHRHNLDEEQAKYLTQEIQDTLNN